MQTKQMTWDERWAEWTMMFPIVGSHIRRIGLARTAAGGLAMYLCIPLLVILAVGGMLVAYQSLLRPLLGIARVRWSDHIHLGRGRAAKLPAFDWFNCDFCAVANGLCTMANLGLDEVAAAAAKTTVLGAWAAALVGAAFWPLTLLFEWAGIRLIYDVLVSRPLGMHRTSPRQAAALMAAEGYANGWSPLGRALIRAHKNTFLRFSSALEQIESAWCPLRHAERRAGLVFPPHHSKFFGPDELEAMRQTLSSVGTVSDRRPTW
jgi:hypothetical protein